MSNDPSNHLLIKVGGAVFATVVAPLIVALGLKWSIFAEVFFRKVQLEQLAADMPGV
jgi:hypothetical protein